MIRARAQEYKASSARPGAAASGCRWFLSRGATRDSLVLPLSPSSALRGGGPRRSHRNSRPTEPKPAIPGSRRRRPIPPCEKKCIKSQEYASEHGLPNLEHVLLPKTKGFICCLQELRSSLDAVYDVTIAYKHRLPDFLDNVYGVDPSEVHIHIRTVQLHQIPTSEDKITEWMIERFRQKDQLLSDFFVKGHFPDEGTEGDLSMPKCLANFLTVVGLTAICLYLTLFSSVWFKVYVVASCAYLSFVTYCSILPPQLIGSPEGDVKAKKAV